MPVWLIREAGECGRLDPAVGTGGGGISIFGPGRGVIDTSNVLPRDLCTEADGDSKASSGEETSLDESLLTVDRLVEVAAGVGVGDLGT